jgi:hypothetical protein
MPRKYINKVRKSIQDRFWEKVDIRGKDECWLWKSVTLKGGYGRFRFNGKYILAHRMAYILTHDEIEDGLIIRHTCDIRPCCNPYHLEKGTTLDNVHDRDIKGRGAIGSKQGHSKLTEKEVIEIRDKLKHGNSAALLARLYDVKYQTITKINHRQTWKHI